MNGAFFLVFGVIMVVGLIGIYGNTLWNIFLAWRTHLTWISALPSQGWVEVTGKIRGETSASMITKTPCVYCQIEVQEWRRAGRGGRWRTSLVKETGTFEVDDGTGRLRITEGNKKYILNDEACIENPIGEQRQILESMGIKFSGIFGIPKRVRVFERLLIEDEEVFVVGKAYPKDKQNFLAGTNITPRLISNLEKQQTIISLFMRDTQKLLVAILILAIAAYFLASIFSQSP